jgi:hypothetical protein
MPETKKKNRSNTRQVVIIIAVMAAVIAVALYIGSNTGGGAGDTVNVNLPVIRTTLTRPSTGEEFNVQTLFSVKIDTEARREVTDTELTEELAKIMEEMDIEKVLGKGKVQYISDRATELLNSYLTDRNINTRVLVVDIATDDRITLEGPDNNSQGVMRGLFQNMD